MTVHTKAATKAEHRPSWLAVRSIMARQDTLRAKAISDIRRTARDDARREYDKQVQAAVDLRLRGQHPDAGQLREQLALIEEALGAKVDFQRNEAHYGWDGRVTLGQIAEIAHAVRQFGDVQRAVSNLTDRWGNPVKNTQGALDRLGAALDELAKVGRPAKATKAKPPTATPEPPAAPVIVAPAHDLFSEAPL